MTRPACAAPTSACCRWGASCCSPPAPASPWPLRELVLVLLGPQWDLAATIVPWFALAGACSVISALSQVLAEARADLNRSLGIQGAYILALAALLALALRFRSHGVWVFGAAVAVAEAARHLGYLELMRRILRLSADQIWRSYGPAAFASVGVGLAVAVTRMALVGDLPTLLVLGAEVGAGAVALALCIRFCPLPAIRSELWMRLQAAGLLGRVDGLRWRLAPLVLGPPEPASSPSHGHDRPACARRRAVGRRRPWRRAHRGAPAATGHRGRSGPRPDGAERRPAGPGAGAGVTRRHRLQVYDVVFVLLLGAGTLRLLRVRRFTGFQRCLVLLGLLVLLSLARGATAFGIEHSVAESRLYLPFVSTALYFATFPPSNALSDRIGKLWLAMSIPMMVLVFLRWLAVFGGIDVGVPAAEFGADAAVKVIDGPFTFFLGMAVVLTVPYWPLRGRGREG